jgi:ABC-type multidrug transport system fused ATPase/permease subunit
MHGHTSHSLWVDLQAGISTIRSYNQEERFVTENQRKLDENQKAYFASVVANRWLGIRVEFIGTCVVSLAALFAVLERDNIDPGMAGLSLTYALSITGVLNW